MQAAFGTVLWIVCGLGLLIALAALITAHRTWEDYGRGHMVLDRDSTAGRGTSAGSAAALLERDTEIRQMLEARNARRARRGEPPIEGGTPEIVHPTQLGGTRHLSAAQFVHDQRHAVALVASQDGRFTIFAWSPCEDMVHAHRVETLLL